MRPLELSGDTGCARRAKRDLYKSRKDAIMGNTKEILMQGLRNIPIEFLDVITQVIENHEEEVIEQMRGISIIHTTDALLEAKQTDEKIISLLQKYYDLRRSEAENAIKQAKNRLAREK